MTDFIKKKTKQLTIDYEFYSQDSENVFPPSQKVGSQQTDGQPENLRNNLKEGIA